MVYMNDNVKIMNTDDIISYLSKLKDIKRVIKECYNHSEYKEIGINIDNIVDNVLYNIVDDLKGHQNIETLENEIITICNNTIDKYNLNVEKISVI